MRAQTKYPASLIQSGRTAPINLTPNDISHLQRTIGNNSIRRLIQHNAVQTLTALENNTSITQASQIVTGQVYKSANPHISILQRWATPDERVMVQVHNMVLLDAFRAYAREAASPSPNWPSRREAIRQAIRDRLNILASSGQAVELDSLARQLGNNPELTTADDWLVHVLRHYRSRVENANSNSDAEPNVPNDPDILAAAGAAVSAGTFSIAVYTGVTGVEGEFRRAAQSFAEDHRSMGVRNGRLVVGRRAAIAATSTADVVNTVNSTLQQVRLLLRRPDATVDTLALFAHGVNASRMPGGRSYLNLTGGHQITNPEQTGHGNATDQLPAADFVNQVSAALSDRARVVLYACELGDSFYGGENAGHYQEWNATQQDEARRGALADEQARGNTSFADVLRDLLNATGANREVWGHRTTGHTTANPTWRHYGSGTQAGADNPFGEELAQQGLSAQDGWDLANRNILLARNTVNDIGSRLRNSLPSRTLQAIESRGHGLRGWIARELPFAPTPFVAGNPPVVRDEVVRFLERQAIQHEPAN